MTKQCQCSLTSALVFDWKTYKNMLKNFVERGFIMNKHTKLIAQLKEEKLLPLYTATNLDYLDTLENVLLKNHLSFIEVTYRSELASEAINYLAKSGKLIVGAGTVRNLETTKDAVENGAQFIVTPGLSEEVIEYCLEKEILIIPGAVTPTEITKVMDYGIKNLKFFPANIYGGLDAIKALSGPFYDVSFVPTGGVDLENVNEFLQNDAVLAVGGSFIISEKLIAEDNGDAANKNLQKIIKKIS